MIEQLITSDEILAMVSVVYEDKQRYEMQGKYIEPAFWDALVELVQRRSILALYDDATGDVVYTNAQ